MKIKILRHYSKKDYTIGHLFIDGRYYCDTLEPADRNLYMDTPPEEIAAIKNRHGKTAIPYGVYAVTVNHSNRFGKPMPLVLDTPGFRGIRIHPGNTVEDTEGCILPGWNQKPGFVADSRKAYRHIVTAIETALLMHEKVTLQIIRQ